MLPKGQRRSFGIGVFWLKPAYIPKEGSLPFFMVCFVLIMAMTVVAFCSVGRHRVPSRKIFHSWLGLFPCAGR